MHWIRLAPLSNGAHENQNVPGDFALPEGWAVIPEGMVLPDSFPFVAAEAAEIGGVMTVTKLEAAEGTGMDAPDEPEAKSVQQQLADLQTALEDADALNVDQEYRLTLLELGIE